MNVRELVAQLSLLELQGHGNKQVLDTDGHPIIGVNVGEDLPEAGIVQSIFVYIEAEF